MKIMSRLWEKITKKGISAHQIAWSGALGIYLAFSPFLGIQTILVFVLSFIFRAKSMIVFTVLYTINNPWTMIPIAVFDYAFGNWLIYSVFGLDLSPYDPAWFGWINAKLCATLCHYLGIKSLCFWSFIIGGNIIAIPAAIIAYPLFKRVAEKQIQKLKTN